MIEVESVSKAFGKKIALDDVSMVVPNGSVTGFVGPNGAGKTTLMKIIGALIPPTSGYCTVDGLPFTASKNPASTLGICISPSSLPAHLSGRQLLRFVCRTQGTNPNRVAAVLEQVGLTNVGDKRIKQYSTGMRQRFALGLALISNPTNLILDEPVNGLDMSGVRWMRDLLLHLASQGTAVLLSSHILSELSLVATNVVMLSHGKVVKEGPIDLILRETERGVRVDSPHLDALLAQLELNGIPTLKRGDGAIVGASDPVTVASIAMAGGFVLSHLSLEQDSLESVFMASTDPEIREGENESAETR